jgi:hypothetical protein
MSVTERCPTCAAMKVRMDHAEEIARVAARQAIDLDKENGELREKLEELHIECGVLAGNLTACRQRLERARLTDEERERVLWWLRRPVHPGPLKALDEQIIRKIKGRQ